MENNLNNNNRANLNILRTTKNDVISFLKTIKSDDFSDSITVDAFVRFSLKLMDKKNTQELILESLSWETEGRRLRSIFETECEPIADSEWIQYLQTDDYRKFAKKHSRLPLPWEKPTKMFSSRAKKKILTKNNKSVILESESA